MIVHVHAYETAPGGDAGSGGFDWYHGAEQADRAFAEAGRGPEEAHFRFDVEVEATDADGITDEIDAQLPELTAAAATRYVGAQVLEYWQRNGFDMGDADSPASTSPRP